MLDSTASILAAYIGKPSRFELYAIEVTRSENLEDLFYMCHTKSGCYLIHETDYVHSLEHTLREATAILADQGMKPIHWLTPRDAQSSSGTEVPLNKTVDEASFLDSLTVRPEGSYLRYFMLAVGGIENRPRPYDPLTYGASIPKVDL